MAASATLLTESALGWSIFTVVLVVILAFCWVYIRKYQSRQESEVISTITAICALAVALITSALLPVDIFLVSFMKYPNGTYKDWAAINETRKQIEDTVLYGYYNIASLHPSDKTCAISKYCILSLSTSISRSCEWMCSLILRYQSNALYSIVLFCVFFWIPFVYFYYEEKDEDNVSKCSQVKNALKYTIGFVIVCAALLLIGTFVPLPPPSRQNSTQWEKVQYLFKELGSRDGVAALSFSISSLTLIGMLAVITYTAYGMSALPLTLIKGVRSVRYERLENTEDTEQVEQRIGKLKAKCGDGRPLSMRDRRTLQDLETRLQTLRRQARHLEVAERDCCTKVGGALRPLKILLGVFFFLVALLFVAALFISNLDKALHSAGINTGFVIFGTNLTNPLNELLLALQPVFPLDYVLITVITVYFVFTSMAGIRNMGIWFFWMRLYKIRPERTRPQALLFLCMILLLIVLHTSYMIYSLAPQYVMYGSQKYQLQTPQTTAVTTKICDADAPEDQCTITRTYLFLHKFWFFSTVYYFGNWAFLAVFTIGLMVSCCKGKKSVIEGEVAADDSDFSDDEYVH
ncbi:lysosomal cobalamin transport escort protein LMBD1 isoform X1 [Electrophorus electricus]|uniref:lysosomal cobalamin transport escort protein LMBD1 isoform X1 n=2 Tax=Electrophorus electricus TaxID=8005 RepID=UPI0015D00E9C|nr:lysosomal cobalamin transport escort protein LMBD1 isoform X1 [Electrophorus electricus]